MINCHSIIYYSTPRFDGIYKYIHPKYPYETNQNNFVKQITLTLFLHYIIIKYSSGLIIISLQMYISFSLSRNN